MTEAIDDVSELPGKTVQKQDSTEIGEIQDVYAVGGDGEPMYVSVEAKFGMKDKQTVLIPLARLKWENGEVQTPYSMDHIKNTPKLENEDEISEEEDRALRDHYGIDSADQELRHDNDSYATRVTEDKGTLKKADDADSLETPDADLRDEDTMERARNAGSAEAREVDAEAITEASQGGSKEESTGSKEEESGGDKKQDSGEEKGSDDKSEK